MLQGLCPGSSPGFAAAATWLARGAAAAGVGCPSSPVMPICCSTLPSLAGAPVRLVSNICDCCCSCLCTGLSATALLLLLLWGRCTGTWHLGCNAQLSAAPLVHLDGSVGVRMRSTAYMFGVSRFALSSSSTTGEAVNAGAVLVAAPDLMPWSLLLMLATEVQLLPLVLASRPSAAARSHRPLNRFWNTASR
ncbi:hypothetical protein COO60DRAFT_1543737 [Scenedesmus sp. NREL 46B-D3]|nr:hypothetical protein COO60DRAFT_1543737 [Scenedesmus sp. NREL 46B-D3]